MVHAVRNVICRVSFPELRYNADADSAFESTHHLSVGNVAYISGGMPLCAESCPHPQGEKTLEQTKQQQRIAVKP
jgi:hypothetical protein